MDKINTEPDEGTEAPTVRVPTHVDVYGRPDEWVETTPDNAWQWDVTEWERLS